MLWCWYVGERPDLVYVLQQETIAVHLSQKLILDSNSRCHRALKIASVSAKVADELNSFVAVGESS